MKSLKDEVLVKQRYKTKKEAKLEILNYLEVYYNEKGIIHRLDI